MTTPTTPILSLSGDATGSVAFSGQYSSSLYVTLASVATPGTYTKVKVDAKGRVTVGSSLTTSDVVTGLGFTPVSNLNPVFTNTLTLSAQGKDAVATLSIAASPSVYDVFQLVYPNSSALQGTLILRKVRSSDNSSATLTWTDKKGGEIYHSGNLTFGNGLSYNSSTGVLIANPTQGNSNQQSLSLVGVPSLTVTPYGQPNSSALTSAACQNTDQASSPSTAQYAAVYGFNPSTGQAQNDAVGGRRGTLYLSLEASPGAGNVFGQVLNLGLQHSYLGHIARGLEIDVRNDATHYGDPAGYGGIQLVNQDSSLNRSASGLVIGGSTGSFRITDGLRLSGSAGGGPLFNNAIVVDKGSVRQVSFADYSSSLISFQDFGSHRTGIDLTLGTYARAAIVLAAGQGLRWLDSTGAGEHTLITNRSSDGALLLGATGIPVLAGGAQVITAGNIGGGLVWDGTTLSTANSNNTVTSFNSRTGDIILTGSDVNTALGFTPYNSTNPNNYQTALQIAATYAPLNSPPFTGNPTAITQLSADNSTRLATTAYVTRAVAASIGTGGVTSFNSRTGAVTLASNDVTTALGFTPYNSTNPSNYQTAAQIAITYAALSGAAFTATPTAPTAATGDNSLKLATTQFVASAISTATGAISGVTSFNGRTGTVTLVSNDVTTALGFAPYSTSNPSNYQTASQIAATYAPLTGAAFTTSPTAPTPTAGDNTTKLATTQFVTTALAGATGGSSGVTTFNTRSGTVTLTNSDVTTALGFTPYNSSNPSSYQTASQIAATYAPLSGAAFTTSPTAPTPTTGDVSFKLATTAFVGAAVNASVTSFNSRVGVVTLTSSDVTTALGFTPYNSTNPSNYQTASQIAATYAPLASPTLTGTPTAPTATAGDNTTKLATTAFVASAVAAGGGGGGGSYTGISINGTTIVASTGSPYQMVATDRVVDVNKTTGAATTIWLPTSPTLWVDYTIIDGKGDSTTNNITITGSGITINGASSYVINYNTVAVTLRAVNSTTWRLT